MALFLLYVLIQLVSSSPTKSSTVATRTSTEEASSERIPTTSGAGAGIVGEPARKEAREEAEKAKAVTEGSTTREPSTTRVPKAREQTKETTEQSPKVKTNEKANEKAKDNKVPKTEEILLKAASINTSSVSFGTIF